MKPLALLKNIISIVLSMLVPVGVGVGVGVAQASGVDISVLNHQPPAPGLPKAPVETDFWLAEDWEGFRADAQFVPVSPPCQKQVSSEIELHQALEAFPDHRCTLKLEGRITISKPLVFRDGVILAGKANFDTGFDSTRALYQPLESISLSITPGSDHLFLPVMSFDRMQSPPDGLPVLVAGEGFKGSALIKLNGSSSIDNLVFEMDQPNLTVPIFERMEATTGIHLSSTFISTKQPHGTLPDGLIVHCPTNQGSGSAQKPTERSGEGTPDSNQAGSQITIGTISGSSPGGSGDGKEPPRSTSTNFPADFMGAEEDDDKEQGGTSDEEDGEDGDFKENALKQSRERTGKDNSQRSKFQKNRQFFEERSQSETSPLSKPEKKSLQWENIGHQKYVDKTHTPEQSSEQPQKDRKAELKKFEDGLKEIEKDFNKAINPSEKQE